MSGRKLLSINITTCFFELLKIKTINLKTFVTFVVV